MIVRENKKKSGIPSTKSRQIAQAALTAKNVSPPNAAAVIIDLAGQSAVTEKLQKSSKKVGKRRRS